MTFRQALLRASSAAATLGRRRQSSSFLHEGYADSAANLVEMMRRIVSGGGRGRRKQDIVPKEVVKVFCTRYSQLDDRGKQDLLISLARDFTPTRESVAAAVARYASSVTPGDPSPPRAPDERELAMGSGSTAGEEEISGNTTGEGGVGRVRSGEIRGQERAHVRAYERLREELSPAYEALFRNVVAESDDGVRFIVDLRQDLLEVMRRGRKAGAGAAPAGADPLLVALDGSLRSLLQAWFSVGFLELRRITYEDSGGVLLEKITRYEAVHPVRSLSELKRRLGHGRRCFAFFHPCLPGEPLVFVHVALLPTVAAKMEDIAGGGSGRDVGGRHTSGEDIGREVEEEGQARCAVFYSISSTQKGLQGVQLGNFLIKRVVVQLRAELPQLETFATLSPIPSFRDWLSKKARHRAALGGLHSELSGEVLLTADETDAILFDAATAPNRDGSSKTSATPGEQSRREAEALAVLLSDDGPLAADSVSSRRKEGSGVVAAAATAAEEAGEENFLGTRKAAERALTRLAARYLVRETVRGKILDPVGNFHVSNGARVERVNWMADPSARGVDKSFGVMVNYVYDPLEIESNNRMYLSKGEVPASDALRQIAWSLGKPESKAAREEKPPAPAGFL